MLVVTVGCWWWQWCVGGGSRWCWWWQWGVGGDSGVVAVVAVGCVGGGVVGVLVVAVGGVCGGSGSFW